MPTRSFRRVRLPARRPGRFLTRWQAQHRDRHRDLFLARHHLSRNRFYRRRRAPCPARPPDGLTAGKRRLSSPPRLAGDVSNTQ
jgi:hypothetical protein